MKYFYISLLFIYSINGIGQVSKAVLIEHFTNTYCSICASKNPGLKANLANHQEVMHLSYHPSSPYANCIFSQHNPLENDGRTNFYGVYGGTPRLVIQGQVQDAGVNFADETIFTNALGQKTPIELILNQQKYGVDSIEVQLIIKASVDNSIGNALLFTGLAEDSVAYNAPNGEANHLHVFRKAFESCNGLNVSVPSFSGDSVVYFWKADAHQDWVFESVYAFAILQQSNKDLIQANFLHPDGSPSITGIKENEKSKFKLFPNPTSGVVYIQSDAMNIRKIKVYSLDGKMLYEAIISKEKKIDLSHLNKGMYLIQLLNEEYIEIKRMIVN